MTVKGKVSSEPAIDFWRNVEEVRAQRQSEKLGDPGRRVICHRIEYCQHPTRETIDNFRVLKKIDDNTEEAKDTSGGNQPTGIESAWAGFAFVFLFRRGFDEQTQQASRKHGSRGTKREVGAGRKGERTNAEDFHGDDERNTHQDQAPRKTLIENAADDAGHQTSL